jgi:membrane protein DedA with SNARE-associated domain
MGWSALFGAGLALVLAAIGLLHHLALFAWMIGAGLGVPPGEDLLMASLGAVIAAGHMPASVAVPMAIVAVLTSDALLFSSGQVARAALATRANRSWDRAARHLEALLAEREAVAIAIARFVPGIRTVVFFSLGARGMSRNRFLLIDGCAAAVWVPLIMTCGASVISLMFGERALSLEAWI